MFIQYISANNRGRDFIVGDIHGCLPALEDALNRIGFEPSVDRLFSVGDLVDRGADSLGCLKLLSQPWFYSVIGNHEAMLLTWLGLRDSSYHLPSDFIRNGGGWIQSLSQDEKRLLEKELIPVLLSKPYLLRVSDADLPFSVVHAQRALYRSTPVTDKQLEGGLDLARAEVAFTWGRSLVSSVDPRTTRIDERLNAWVSDTPSAEGVELTYCGHTILELPLLHLSHFHIDTGAYLAKHPHKLSLVSHAEKAPVLKKLLARS